MVAVPRVGNVSGGSGPKHPLGGGDLTLGATGMFEMLWDTSVEQPFPFGRDGENSTNDGRHFQSEICRGRLNGERGGPSARALRCSGRLGIPAESEAALPLHLEVTGR